MTLEIQSLAYDELAHVLGTKANADVPCPECGPQCTTNANAKKPVLRIWHKGESFITFNCARCGVHGYAHERTPEWRKRNPPDLPKGTASIVVPDDDQAKRIERALSIWRDACDIRGTPAETYLQCRGLDTSEDLRHTLRFSSRLHFDGQTVGGMVALFRCVMTCQPVGVHRTFLRADGMKLGRKMLGRSKHAAIMLDDHPDVVSGLHIGEGIESGLAARQLGYRPVWVVGSAGAVAAFPVLAGVEAISVFTENDRASDEAARVMCARYQEAGCEGWICQPPKGDFNDTLREAL
jgi:hypothetical protein